MPLIRFAGQEYPEDAAMACSAETARRYGMPTRNARLVGLDRRTGIATFVALTPTEDDPCTCNKRTKSPERMRRNRTTGELVCNACEERYGFDAVKPEIRFNADITDFAILSTLGDADPSR